MFKNKSTDSRFSTLVDDRKLVTKIDSEKCPLMVSTYDYNITFLAFFVFPNLKHYIDFSMSDE